MHLSRLLTPILGTGCLLGGLAAPAAIAQQPTGLPLDGVDLVRIAPLDLQSIQAQDIARQAQGLAPRYAVPFPVTITPDDRGTWEDLDADTVLWRLRVTSPGALSLNFGFTGFYLPADATLVVHGADQTGQFLGFDARDNAEHGELWTPVVLFDDAVIELTAPLSQIRQVELVLGSINVGYRFFGEKRGGNRSGSCNIDVVCPEGDPWWDEINSVGVISTGGSTFCSGFMVNNTAEDEKPFFMTANHCGVGSGNASSLVVYWNYQSPNCGQQGGGSLSDWQSGSYYRASYGSSDFTLVELDSAPNPNWNVSFSGWNRTSADATAAVAIHHPATDEKSISFEDDPCTTTSYLGTSSPGDGTHVRVEDWDLGTTEPGSSGSPLYDQDHHVVGQLHGGYAACGNDLADWYGRFSISWTGGGTSSSRLSNWLDPIGSGVNTLDTLAPGSSGLRVTPSTSLKASGDVGGPFTPSSIDYTLENKNTTGINYLVSTNAVWLDLTNASGSLPGGGTTVVTVSINSLADTLPMGLYEDVVSFENTTDHDGDTTRKVELQVGVPTLAYSFPMNTDPHWTQMGLWDFGQPTGGGGQYGYPDPTSGHTGPNVMGYNLNGDYQNNLGERHLTSVALDCSNRLGTTLRFWRWLGVETSTYDHAYVRVSNDGTSWTTVWENGGSVEDSSWQQVEYDISDVADGQSTVYLRWTMGSTDGSWQYCGWNIDDVEVWGLDVNTAGTYCTPKTTSSGCLPSMSSSGTPSASASSGFTVTATQVEPGEYGLLFFGTSGADNAPFQDGYMCIQFPLVRTPVQNSGSGGSGPCQGILSLDLNATGWCAAIGAGNQAWMQGWFRDPPTPATTGLTNAITFTVQP